MATAAKQAADFLAHVKHLNWTFVRKRSSVQGLLDHLDSELARTAAPPPFAGTDLRARFKSALALCGDPADPRLAKYRTAIWCLAHVWGGTADYPVQGRRNVRILHVALMKYDTTACQTDDIERRKSLLEGALKTVAAHTTDYVNPPTRSLHGVLLGPEYLFAKPAPQGWHQAGDVRHLFEGTKCALEGWLRTLSGSQPAWLLFPGTIAWKKTISRDRDAYIRRHLRADPALTRSTLEARYRQKTGSRTDKALAAIERNKVVFERDHSQVVSDPILGDAYDECGTMPPATDTWYVTDHVTQVLAASPRTGKPEYWTKDPALARLVKVVVHAAPTSQQKIQALSGSATKMARNTCIVLKDGKRVMKYHKMNDFHEVLDDASRVVYVPGVRSPVCKVDGIRFGIEICLDHATETMKRLVGDGSVSPPDFLALLSAWVNYDKSASPPGIQHVAHCSSKQSLNELTSDKPGAVVLELDDPDVRLYSLIMPA